MSLERTKRWGLATCIALLMPTLAAAQNLQPFGPADADALLPYDAQPFGMVDVSEYGGMQRANEGFYFVWDGISWWVSMPDERPIGRPGGAETVVVNDTILLDVFNTLDTGSFDAEMDTGQIIEFGYVQCCEGWNFRAIDINDINDRRAASEATILFNDPQELISGFVDLNFDGFDDDVDGNDVYGRFGRDVGVVDDDGTVTSPVPDGIPDGPLARELLDVEPTQDSDAAADADPADLIADGEAFFFDDVTWRTHTEIYGFEVNRIIRKCGPKHCGGQFEWQFGVRYFDVEDEFTLEGFGGLLDTLYIGQEVENRIVGPQISLRWERTKKRWKIFAEGRFVPGINFVTFTQRSSIANHFTGNDPPRLRPVASNDTKHDTEFSPLLELRLGAEFKLTQAISVEWGFQGMFVDNVSRAANVVDYTLPSFGILDNQYEDLWMGGPYLGLSVNR